MLIMTVQSKVRVTLSLEMGKETLRFFSCTDGIYGVTGPLMSYLDGSASLYGHNFWVTIWHPKTE